MRWPCCGSLQQSTSSSLSSSLSSLNNEGDKQQQLGGATTATTVTQSSNQNNKDLANGGKRRKGNRLQLKTLNFTRITGSSVTTSANAERRQPEGILKGTHHRTGRPPGRAVQYADGTNSGDDEDSTTAAVNLAEQRPMLTQHQQDFPPTCSSPSPTSSALSSPPHTSSPMDKYGPMLLRPCKRVLLVLPSTSSTPSLPNCSFFTSLRHSGWELQVCSSQSAAENIRHNRPVIILIDGTVGTCSKERALLVNSLSSMRKENTANNQQARRDLEKQQQRWHVLSTENDDDDAEDVLFAWLLHKMPSDRRRRQMAKLGVQQLFLSTSSDISLCEQFCRLSSRLRAVPALFAVVEEAQQPIKICDDHNIVQYVNKAYELLTGQSRTTVLGSDAATETVIAHRTHHQHHPNYHQQQNNRPITNTPNNVATAAITASATAAVTAAISWSTVAGVDEAGLCGAGGVGMTGPAVSTNTTGNNTPCSPPPQLFGTSTAIQHPPLITTSPPPMANAEEEEQDAKEHRGTRGETMPPIIHTDKTAETLATTAHRKRSSSGGDQPSLTIVMQQQQNDSNEKPDRPPPPSPAASRRCSSDWQCIAVPTNSNSQQYVYVKRGSADAAFFRSDRTEKGRSPGWVDAPITEALSALGNILHRCDEETQTQLREAMRILSCSELYTPTITRFRENDRIASGYYDGLIRLHHPNRQRKRSVVDAFRDHQQRRASAGSTISGLVGHVEGLEQHHSRLHHHFHSKESRIIPHVIAVHRRVSTEIINVLEREEFWDFNVIELERVSDHHPLLNLGLKIFERWNVAEALHCSDDVLHKWFAIVEANYQAGNAYHNATHAADVLQATSYFLNSDPVGQLIQDQHAPAALIAATVHDLDHPGRGNAFLMNTRQRLALLYNDHSILENHHVALAFQLTLAQPGVNIFAQMAREEFTQMRQAIIDMVLATDMSKHFEHLAKFQQLMAILPDADDDRDANSLIISRMMIKCADIGNPTREWKLCYEWAIRIVHEYFDQTAEEIERKLPVTMKGFDRETCNVPLTQCTFVDMFARETFTLWCEFADLPHLMTHLEENYAQWKAQSTDWNPKKNANLLQQHS